MVSPITGTPLVLVQISDPHLLADPAGRLLGVNTDASLRRVLDEVRRCEPHCSVLLVTGDIAQDGSALAYRRFLLHAASLRVSVHGLPGNHDCGDMLRAVWQERLDPVVDLGAWRMVLLDSSVPGSNTGHLAQRQLALLQAAARQAQDRHVLVAVHHNPLPMGSAWLDTMTIGNGDALLGCVGKLPNVRCLVWGHVHQEHDAVRHYGQSHAVRLIASPSTCVQFRPHSETFALDAAAPAYRWLRLYPDGAVETGVRRVEGLALEPDTDSTGY